MEFTGLVDVSKDFNQYDFEADIEYAELNKLNLIKRDSVSVFAGRVVMDKLKNTVKATGIKEIAIGGGVSANSGIRKALKDAERTHGWTTHIPRFEYCTDNAAMIAMVGELKYKEQRFAKHDVVAKARMKL